MSAGLTVADLALAARRMAATSRRTEIAGIAGDLLGRASASEIGPLVHLLQGRLAPPFSPVVDALGETVAHGAVAAAYGLSREQVDGLCARVGDLPGVASELAHGTHPLDLLEAYRELVGVAQEQGAGAEERRAARLGALLAGADPEAAAFLVRVALGRLRLGLGTATLIESLVLARSGDPRYDRPLLELAYNRSSDLGAVARHYAEHGTDGLASFAIRVGQPVRPALAETLPDAETVIARLGEVAAEGKFDGLRCQVHKDGPHVRLFGRSLDDITALYPEVTAAIASLSPERVILEGEIVAVHPGSGELLSVDRLPGHPRSPDGRPALASVRLFAFDLLLLENEDLTPRPYRERHAQLDRIIPAASAVLELSRAETVSTSAELGRLFEACVADGLEGVLCKRLDAPYQAGLRTFDWVKLKRTARRAMLDTVDCAVIGYNVGRDGACSLLLSVYDDDTDEHLSLCRLGAGITESEMAALVARVEPHTTEGRPEGVRSAVIPDRWVRPQLVLEILAEEIVPSPRHIAGGAPGHGGYTLRAPRLIRIRDDKRPDQVTTVEELCRAYAAQPTRAVVREIPGR